MRLRVARKVAWRGLDANDEPIFGAYRAATIRRALTRLGQGYRWGWL
jgi:hypothetical protein